MHMYTSSRRGEKSSAASEHEHEHRQTRAAQAPPAPRSLGRHPRPFRRQAPSYSACTAHRLASQDLTKGLAGGRRPAGRAHWSLHRELYYTALCRSAAPNSRAFQTTPASPLPLLVVLIHRLFLLARPLRPRARHVLFAQGARQLPPNRLAADVGADGL